MELWLDILMDALIDSIKLFPFLLLTYLLMEYLEHKLKKEVLKVKDKTQVDYEESAFDDDDDFDLFDGIMESTEDDIFAEAMTDADDLLADLDEIIL